MHQSDGRTKKFNEEAGFSVSANGVAADTDVFCTNEAFATAWGFPNLGPMSTLSRAFILKAWFGAALQGSFADGVKGEDVPVPEPETIEVSTGCANEEYGDAFHCRCSNTTHPNYLAAEFCLQHGRFDEAHAHAQRYERHSWGAETPCFAPWLQGRIIGRKTQAATMGQPTENKEAFGLLQRAHAAAKKWGSPLIATLAVQEMIALCPKQAAATNAGSLLEEETFELVMDTASPMRAHIESGGTFSP